MTEQEIIEICNDNIVDRVLTIPESIIAEIDPAQAFFIREHFRGQIFIKFPNTEIQFFEWLKVNDAAVWDDLWSDSPEEPYIVSIDFLPHLVKKGRGFPICDLVNTENYYFAPIHINGREAEFLTDTIKQRFLSKESLTTAQTLLMEISMDPIDIWHFAYKYKISIAQAKEAVAQLLEDQTIVHFTNADHLANFIEV